MRKLLYLGLKPILVLLMLFSFLGVAMATSAVFPTAEYKFVCDNWRLNAPSTIFGVGKIGLRRGHVFVLSMKHDGAEYALPIMFNQPLGSFFHKNGSEPLSTDDSEQYLAKLSSSETNGPLLVTVEEWKVPPSWTSHTTVTDLAPTTLKAPQSDAAWEYLRKNQSFVDDLNPYLDPITSVVLAILAIAVVFLLFKIRIPRS